MADPERWLVVSNCNTFGLVNSLNLLCPDIHAVGMDYSTFVKDVPGHNEQAAAYDRVITYTGIQELNREILVGASNLSYIPPVVFDAYHPDMCYVHLPDHTQIRGALETYHSLLGFVGFKLGMSVEETLRLFRRDIFEKCGYLDRWDKAENRLYSAYDPYGIDVRSTLRKASRGKTFMHSFNHPGVEFLFGLARAYLEKEGMAARAQAQAPMDNLALGAVYPVYPEVGDAYGVAGSYLFKKPGQYKYLDLPAYLESEFAAFSQHPKAQMQVAPMFAGSYDHIRKIVLEAR